MDALARLFGSAPRVKLIRLFLAERTAPLSAAEAAARTKVSSASARKEIAVLLSAGLIKRKAGTEARYHVNPRFEYLAALESFIRATTAVHPERLLGALRRAGSLRLVLLSGLFTGAAEAPVDLIVVGEGLAEGMLARAVREAEAELGKEIRYAVFTTEEFRYRMGIYDRLIRDVLDYPHRLLLDRIGL